MGATVSRLERKEGRRNLTDESEQYKQSFALISTLVSETLSSELKASVASLKGADAQNMVDFLDKVLDDNVLESDQRRRLLYLFMKLIKSAQVYPKSLELTGVICNLAHPVNEGGYGSIYQGKLHGHAICVKAVRMYQVGIAKQKLRAHAGEFALWAHISHPNVLPFYGVYASEERRVSGAQISRICMVSPWIEAGSLLIYLKYEPASPRVPLLIDILSGLEHLHQMDVIHADIKADNVLVSETGRAMLADFGVSFVGMTHVGSTTAADFAGSANWMAPELFTADRPVPTRESDMWSFGCTCYEVITGKIPFEQYKVTAQLIRAFINGGVNPLQMESDNGKLEDNLVKILMRQCFNYETEDRPSATEAKSFLISLKVVDHRPPVDTERGILQAKNPRPGAHRSDYNTVYAILQKIHLSNLKARVLYDYTACPGDPNEIAFSQGELLDVVDGNGMWWQVQKADGTVGIAPSRSLLLVTGLNSAGAVSVGRTENGSQSPLRRSGVGVSGDGPLCEINPTAGPAWSSTDTLYKHKARALYAYTANPDDPYEISFRKGEILAVDSEDTGGGWRQARKSDGTLGIAPPNYLSLT